MKRFELDNSMKIAMQCVGHGLQFADALLDTSFNESLSIVDAGGCPDLLRNGGDNKPLEMSCKKCRSILEECFTSVSVVRIDSRVHVVFESGHFVVC